MPRRSLIDSISDEERDFIEAGRPQSTSQAIVREEAPAPKDEEPPAPKKPPAPRKAPSAAALPPVLVSQTYRLPAESGQRADQNGRRS